MSGPQKLNTALESMVRCLETMKNEQLTLTEMMDEFSRAIEGYKQYQACVSNESLDVKEVRFEAGELIEASYNWKDM